MFGQISPTPYDLHFSVIGIPVRVHPMFWLISAIMGWQAGRLDLVMVWIGCVFVSILIHELGHALAARSFGWPPHIVLFHFGGYAAYQPTWGHTAGRSIFISFAGPGAGFILFGLVLALRYTLIQTSTNPGELAVFAIIQMEHINLWWGLVNLLPVLPLDGGRICQELCTKLRRRDGQVLALQIAMVVSGGVAFYFLSHHENFGYYPGILFGVLCYQNFQTYQAYRGGRW